MRGYLNRFSAKVWIIFQKRLNAFASVEPTADRIDAEPCPRDDGRATQNVWILLDQVRKIIDHATIARFSIRSHAQGATEQQFSPAQIQSVSVY